MNIFRQCMIDAVFLLTLAGYCHQSFAQSNVILGVLEDSPSDVAGVSNTRDVRVVFEKVGGEWRPYPSDCSNEDCLKTLAYSYPRVVSWTIAFDGKKVGQVKSHAPEKFRAFWRVGQQEIDGSTPIPTIGTRAVEFGGFLGAEVYRPLVAVSQPNFRDPGAWRPAPLSPDVLHALRQQFRLKYPKMCRAGEDETSLVPFSYKDEEVTLVKSFASRTGWKVASLDLNATDCNGTEAGSGIDDPWFVIDDEGNIRYLASGMFLVDAGDYDADGKSELLFSISQDNVGGYRIYYDDFRKSAEFKFGYH